MLTLSDTTATDLLSQPVPHRYWHDIICLQARQASMLHHRQGLGDRPYRALKNESTQWEVDPSSQFIGKSAAVCKALELHHEHLRKAPQV